MHFDLARADKKGDPDIVFRIPLLVARPGCILRRVALDPPLLYGDILYFPKTDHNILSCVNARTGERHYPLQRLDGIGRVSASPVAARDRESRVVH